MLETITIKFNNNNPFFNNQPTLYSTSTFNRMSDNYNKPIKRSFYSKITITITIHIITITI